MAVLTSSNMFVLHAFSLLYVLCGICLSVQAADVVPHHSFSPRQITPSKALNWDPKQTPFPSTFRDNTTTTFTSASKGTVVVLDPYHWFQDANASASQIQAFINSQGALTKEYLENVKDFDAIRSSLRKADEYKVLSLAQAFGPKNSLLYLYYVLEANETKQTYYLSNQADLDQAIDAKFTFYPGTKLLDTNLVGVHKIVFEVNVSPDGTKFLYSIADETTGLNATTHFRNVSSPLTKEETKKDGDIGNYPEIIHDSIKTQWGPDSNSVFYAKREDANPANYSSISSLLYHVIGTDVKDDVLIAQPESFPRGYHDFEVSDDMGSLIIFLLSYTYDLVETSQVYIASLGQPLQNPLTLVKVSSNQTFAWSYLTNIGSDYYFKIAKENSGGQIIRCKVDLSQAKSSTNLQDLPQLPIQQEIVIPERINSTIKGAVTFDTNRLFIRYSKDGFPSAFIFDLTTGKELFKIKFIHPDYPASLYYVKAAPYGTDIFAYIIPFNTPAVVVRARWNTSTNQISHSQYYEAKTDFIVPDDFIAKETWINSTDGVQVPIYLLYHKNLTLDGSAPLFLQAYGAYQNTVNGEYDRQLYTFAHDFNGVVAYAGVRGGNDVGGNSWHEAGMLANKQHTFEDILAVANALIDQNFSSPGKIILYGEGAGAMAGAAVINQAPQGLFGGFIGSDGFYDLFHADPLYARFRNPEFGDPQNSTAFDWLSTYSPVQNIDKSKPYPTIVLSTANKEFGNEAWQTYEMIANLQYLLPSNPNPIFLVNGLDLNYTEKTSITLSIVTHALGLHRKV